MMRLIEAPIRCLIDISPLLAQADRSCRRQNLREGMGWDGLISKGLEGVGSLSLPAVSKSPGATQPPWLLHLRQISLTVFLGFGTAAAVPKNILIKTKRL